MIRSIVGSLLLAVVLPAAPFAAAADAAAKEARIVEGEFRSELLPRSMRYGVLLPAAYARGDARYPVLFLLYPGSPESHLAIRRWQAHVRWAWDAGRLPDVIVVTPAIDVSMYQDAQGEGQRWEQAFVGPFLAHLRREFRIREDRPAFFATGISAGGAIALRLGLGHPEVFGGIAALAPGIEAASTIDTLTFEDTFWKPAGQYAGVDADAWARHHPINIATANAARIRASGLAIYLECGDEDSFLLDRGTERLHRVLSDAGIAHEYRLRRGVDHHVGKVMPERWQDAYAFLGSQMRDLQPEPIVADLRAAIAALRAQAEKRIPNDPQLNALRMPLFQFSRRQAEIEAAILESR